MTSQLARSPRARFVVVWFDAGRRRSGARRSEAVTGKTSCRRIRSHGYHRRPNFTDNIYISTDSSDWNPTAIKLDRVDAYKYRALRYFASGTKFAYRVTRGILEFGRTRRGQPRCGTPHQFFVREVDSLAARVTVYHWSDERGSSLGNRTELDSDAVQLRTRFVNRSTITRCRSITAANRSSRRRPDNASKCESRALAGAFLRSSSLWPISAPSQSPSRRSPAAAVLFYNDSLAIVVRKRRDGMQLANGMTGSPQRRPTSILRSDRAVVRRRRRKSCVARRSRCTPMPLALDFPGRKSRHACATTRASSQTRTATILTPLQAAPGKTGPRFAFPDLIDGRAYIRARRRGDRLAHECPLSVRRRFPRSTGRTTRADVSLYVCGRQRLRRDGALSQPRSISPTVWYSTPNALTVTASCATSTASAPSLGIEQNIIDNNDGFLAGALDVPVRIRRSTRGSTGIAVWVRPAPCRSAQRNRRRLSPSHARLHAGDRHAREPAELRHHERKAHRARFFSLRTRDHASSSTASPGITSVNFGFHRARRRRVFARAKSGSQVQTVWQKAASTCFVASPLDCTGRCARRFRRPIDASAHRLLHTRTTTTHSKRTLPDRGD